MQTVTPLFSLDPFSFPLVSLWISLATLNKKGMLMKAVNRYLSMIVSSFSEKKEQFIKDIAHLRLPWQEYILNIYLLFTPFPSAL